MSDSVVTMDTHAVAAAYILPLSGESPEVTANFSGVKNAKEGFSGTYALIAEAYRRAATEKGVLPSEMQSITWEAIREIYTAAGKRDSEMKERARELWRDYVHKKIYHENEYNRTTAPKRDPYGLKFQSAGRVVQLAEKLSARPSSIQAGAADRLRERLAAVNQEFAGRGYGNAEPVSGSKLLRDLGLLQSEAAGVEPGKRGVPQGISGAGQGANGPDFAKLGYSETPEDTGEHRGFFASKLAAAADADPLGQQVIKKTPDQLKGARLFTALDGKVGFAIYPTGEIGSFFAHPDAVYDTLSH